MCLVFELMENGSLQDCLFGKRKGEGMMLDWGVRVRVAIDVAKGLEFLHHECEPGIIHGDLKPSNVLIGDRLKAKIGDFGLARFKVGENECSSDLGQQLGLGLRAGNGIIGNGDDAGSVGETESVVTTTTVGFDDGSVSVVIGMDRSPEGNVGAEEHSPGMVTMSDKGRGQVGEDVDGGNGREVMGKSGEEKGGLGLSNVGSGSRKVKDYVMEWIGSEVRKERPLGGWIGGSSSKAAGSGKMMKKVKKGEKRPEWWVSMDEEKGLKKEKRKTVREWWKEEYVEELERKNKKNKKRKNKKEAAHGDGDQDNWWPKDDAMYHDRKKSRSRTSSRGSLDWWLDGLGSDHGKFRGSNYDSGSGEMPRSGGLSSTPSMRGTVCYIAPEYSAGGDLSEKCDVYSYGVLLLVLIAGRRPLQVTSPVSEYRRANLISWARRLARKGKLLDLVDKRVHSLSAEQAQLFITVALVCLQKSPGSRPSMKEVVGMLTGELGPPVLPMEFTPSPPSRLPYKSQKNPR